MRGSIRKKGKKYYYRYYVKNAFGQSIQIEKAGTPNKKETEKLLREAIRDYEINHVVANREGVTLEKVLDMWTNEELMVSQLANGTVDGYMQVVRRLKEHPIAKRKIETITPNDLQQLVDLLLFGGTGPDGKKYRGYSSNYLHAFTAVLNHVFRFAAFPKGFVITNPMQYVVIHRKSNQTNIFPEEYSDEEEILTITQEQFEAMIEALGDSPAALPIQISYYTGLRIGEACSLVWEDINLDEKYMIVRRSVRRNSTRKCMEIGPAKRNKIRTVDFGENLTAILNNAKELQKENDELYADAGFKNYYNEISDRGRTHYELYALKKTDEVPEGYRIINMICTKPDGSYESPEHVAEMCREVAGELESIRGFHFHLLRHSYTTNLLINGAAPKDVAELLGHSDVNTTMNIYAHSNREAKRKAAHIIDKIANKEMKKEDTSGEDEDENDDD